jgi:C-terminal processing protease CtpA/Prc
MGTDVVIFYAASITVSDIVMSDGKSLENVGVKPDETLLPKPEELAASKDPVMSQAMAAVDIELDPEDAAKLFPLEWSK